MKKVKIFIDLILNLILPKDAGITEIENMSDIDILNNLPQANDINNKYKALFCYKNKIVRKVIWNIKYKKNQKLNKKFSGLLYEFILENISDEMLFSRFKNPLLIPIPMHKNNLKKRGYNQSELIVQEIFEIDKNKNFEISLNSLLKTKETPHQSELKNKTKRLENLKNCFYADIKKIKNRNIILIDDVITTGTTMKEAVKTLQKVGAKKVIGFSLAH
ncbi:MAG: phosphoribosyltransferase family protein [bacterium]